MLNVFIHSALIICFDLLQGEALSRHPESFVHSTVGGFCTSYFVHSGGQVICIPFLLWIKFFCMDQWSTRFDTSLDYVNSECVSGFNLNFMG